MTTTTVVAVVVYYAFRLAEQAQQETDTLLHSSCRPPSSSGSRVRPAAIIADELADASVLFADLKGFVPLAKRPRAGAHGGAAQHRRQRLRRACRPSGGVEKIKTIGDAYMAAAGVPQPAPPTTPSAWPAWRWRCR